MALAAIIAMPRQFSAHPVTPNLKAKIAAGTSTSTDASRNLLETIFASAKVMKPRPIPVAIEYVSGIEIAVTTAGA
jgi:hypothetical protein